MLILRRALTDAERGLGSAAARRRPTTRWRRWRASPAATRGRALNLLELAATAAAEDGDGRRRIDRAVARTGDPAADARLRQERRRALQPHLRAAQVDAQQRSRCRGLLARADARGRRGSALRRAADGPLRVGRHRQRRPAGARRCRGRQGRRALHRHARGQHRARAGRHLPGHRAEEQRGLHGLRTRRARTPSARWPTRCRCTCATRRRS